MKTISERIETPIKYTADVAVCGGGVAGIAAAISAAREGANVVLLERSFMLGGLATSGLVTIYLPICDGLGRQVSFGLADELLRLSIEHGADARYPTAWLDGGSFEERRDGKRFEVQFNPHFFAISAEKLLVSLGVRIIYGVTVASVAKEDDKISAIIIEGKSSREAIAVNKCVVDTTGDADVVYLSGADYAEYDFGNTLAAWYYWSSGEGNRLSSLGFADVAGNCTSGRSLNNKKYRGLDTLEISDMVIDMHSTIEKDVLKRRGEGEKDLIPTCIATIPQVRMTRGLRGLKLMTLDDDGKYSADSVGLFSNWRRRGPVYELPFAALHSTKVKNLLAAGRAFAAEEKMWDITRVIPVCAVSGEAAGVAATMGDDMTSLDVALLQKKLKERGVKLHCEEIQ